MLYVRWQLYNKLFIYIHSHMLIINMIVDRSSLKRNLLKLKIFSAE